MIFSLAVILLLLEGALRVTGIQKIVFQNPPIYRAVEDPNISYALIPSHQGKAYGTSITTNSLGFRSPELPDDSSPLVLLGDSLVFGYGVKDHQTIGSFLQGLLPGTSVLSVGVSGYNIAQERAVYEKNVAPLQPSVLILVFMPNDMDETFVLDGEGYFRPRSDRDPRTYLQKLDDDLHKPGTLPIPFKTSLQLHSALFTFLERTTKSFAFRSHASAVSIFEDPLTDGQVDAYLAEFRRLSAAAGSIPKMLVIWPEQNLHLRTRERLKETASEEGFVTVDLYEIFGNHYDSLGWDGHPNARTNERTAGIIADAMRTFPQFRSVISREPTRAAASRT